MNLKMTESRSLQKWKQKKKSYRQVILSLLCLEVNSEEYEDLKDQEVLHEDLKLPLDLQWEVEC